MDEQSKRIDFRPQPGPQEAFLASPADICFYGGHAGAGKTYDLLLEPLRYINNPLFLATFFRKEYPDFTMPGGILDESSLIYPYAGLRLRQNPLDWIGGPSKGKISLRHMPDKPEEYKKEYAGLQTALLLLDQAEQLSADQFWFLFSRLRSKCGIRPYCRGTCNADCYSFLANLLSWWIDQETGYAIKERSGKIRWLFKSDNELIWADSRDECLALARGQGLDANPEDIKSVSFIEGTIYDNKILLEQDPGYLGNLKLQDLVTRERLLHGNWKIKPAAGLIFNRLWWPFVAAAPARNPRVRFWDRAGTEKKAGNDPDWTVGLLMSRDKYGQFFIEDMIRMRDTPLAVEKAIKAAARLDGEDTIVGQYQDPGQAGVDQARYMTRQLAGYRVETIVENKDTNKIKAAGPVSSQAEAGNIRLLRGPWNTDFINETMNFPDGRHKDIVSALIGAFRTLQKYGKIAKVH